MFVPFEKDPTSVMGESFIIPPELNSGTVRSFIKKVQREFKKYSPAWSYSQIIEFSKTLTRVFQDIVRDKDIFKHPVNAGVYVDGTKAHSVIIFHHDDMVKFSKWLSIKATGWGKFKKTQSTRKVGDPNLMIMNIDWDASPGKESPSDSENNPGKRKAVSSLFDEASNKDTFADEVWKRCTEKLSVIKSKYGQEVFVTVGLFVGLVVEGLKREKFKFKPSDWEWGFKVKSPEWLVLEFMVVPNASVILKIAIESVVAGTHRIGMKSNLSSVYTSQSGTVHYFVSVGMFNNDDFNNAMKKSSTTTNKAPKKKAVSSLFDEETSISTMMTKQALLIPYIKELF